MVKIAPKHHFLVRRLHLASVIVREIGSYTAVTGKKKAPRPGRQTTNQPIIGVGSRYLDSPVQPRFFLAHYC